MSPRLDRTSSVWRMVAVAAAFAGMLACENDAPLASAPAPGTAPGAKLSAGMISGRVDATGSVSFDPITPAAMSRAPGISAAIYGDQGATVRLYSSDFTIDSTSTPGTKKWSFKVGLRNYLPYPIGANQSGPLPDDTLGIYVVLVEDPVVTSTSSACSGSNCKMELTNPDGVGKFTSPGQKYFHWHERLAARQSAPGADTTNASKPWRFEGPSSITGFRFVVMVSAAWPPEHESSWTVFYDAATDSLPDSAAEPRWKTFSLAGLLGGAGTEAWSNAGLVLSGSNYRNLYMYRSDSLGGQESAYIEARLKVNGGGPGSVFGLQDSGRLAAVGVADGQVGFVSLEPKVLLWWVLGYEWEFIGTPHTLPQNGGRNLHTYRLRKFGADSVRLEVDGARVRGMSRSQLQQSTDDVQSITAFFGAAPGNYSATSTWSHVTYNLGSTQP